MEDSRRTRKLNNQGISMVEILVVVGIMAILIGGISLGFAVITNSYAREAASYVTDALGTARTKATSVTADEWNITFTYEGANKGYTISVNKVTFKDDGAGGVKKVVEAVETYSVDSEITIKYHNGEGTDTSADTVPITGSANSPLTIKYSAGQGSIEGVYLGESEYKLQNAIGKNLSEIGSIIIESGSFSRTIEIYHTTGKYDIIDD